MNLTRGEKKYTVMVCIGACLLGAFAALYAYSILEEGQFHGGVLEEDRAEATWYLIRAAIIGFAEYGFGAFFLFGALPIALRRLLLRGADDS